MHTYLFLHTPKSKTEKMHVKAGFYGFFCLFKSKQRKCKIKKEQNEEIRNKTQYGISSA
jgi:hypothetical protein